MIAAQYIPRGRLSEFVSLFWYWDGYVQPHRRERLLPDGSMCIVFSFADAIRTGERENAGDSGTGASVICGARAGYFETSTADMVTTLGIQFRPGGAFPFLPMPASELNEQCVSLEDVFAGEVRSLRDRLLECSSPRLKFAVVERWLLSRAVKPLEKHRAVDYATRRFLTEAATQPLADVLDRLGYSRRHFNQLFTAEVGLTPKRFLRVRRFQWVIAAISRCTSVDWAEVALRCGYYDQSHFAHDFRCFSGLTPTSYLALRTPHLNHLPVLD